MRSRGCWKKGVGGHMNFFPGESNPDSSFHPCVRAKSLMWTRRLLMSVSISGRVDPLAGQPVTHHERHQLLL